MNSGDFSSKILQYLAASGKSLNETLLEEASKRVKDAFKRQIMEDRVDAPGSLRMSAGGHCVRKQWYNYKGCKGEELSPRTINTFLMGDICEVGLSILARLAGWNLLGKMNGEEEVHYDVEKIGARGEPPEQPFRVTGHVDDMLHVAEENKWYLVEFKSASDYSYSKFEKEGLDDTWGYISQSSLYCDALGLDEFIMVYMNKNTGHICDRVIRKDPELVQKAKDNWWKIINKDEMPERKWSPEEEKIYNRKTRAYDITGRSVLPVVCTYCRFLKNCRGDYTVEFKSGRPIYVVNEPELDI